MRLYLENELSQILSYGVSVNYFLLTVLANIARNQSQNAGWEKSEAGNIKAVCLGCCRSYYCRNVIISHQYPKSLLCRSLTKCFKCSKA